MSAVIINIDTALTNVPTIEVGKQGENGATQVVFDVSEMIETYGSGTAYVVVQRRGDAEPYLLDNTSQSGDKVTWTVSNVDTDVYGTGRVQLFWMINEQVAKTVTYQFYVEEALHDPQDAPVVPGGWISDEIGNLDNLTTTAKANLVAAINEVNSKVTTNTTAIGTLANLTTTEKSNLVGAINEVNEDVSDVKEDLEALETQLDETTALALAALPQETIENVAIASFDDGGDGVPVKELKIAIEPIQSGSGDPSPTNVRPISGRDSVTVTRTGVNQWNEEWALGYWNHNDGGSFVANNSFFACKDKIQVLPSTTYYWVFPSITREILFYDESGSYMSYQSYSGSTPKEFTTPSGCKYITFYFGSAYGNTYNHDISINYPNTDTEYHTGSTSYPISLSSTIYGGTLDVGTGVLTVTHGFIESYNGETLPSTWISDRDVYAEGTTPTTGAEVVYALATPTTVQLTPTQVTTLLKDNNIFADSGDVKKLIYRADLGAYIEKLINA